VGTFESFEYWAERAKKMWVFYYNIVILSTKDSNCLAVGATESSIVGCVFSGFLSSLLVYGLLVAFLGLALWRLCYCADCGVVGPSGSVRQSFRRLSCFLVLQVVSEFWCRG
jgi:hypothetical protein